MTSHKLNFAMIKGMTLFLFILLLRVPKRAILVTNEAITSTSKDIPMAYIKHDEVSLWDNKSFENGIELKTYNASSKSSGVEIEWKLK